MVVLRAVVRDNGSNLQYVRSVQYRAIAKTTPSLTYNRPFRQQLRSLEPQTPRLGGGSSWNRQAGLTRANLQGVPTRLLK